MRRWRLSKIRVSVPTVIWITAIWVLLWGQVSPGNIVAGLLVGLSVQTFLPLPTVGYHGRIRPRRLANLISRFAFDLVVASFQVAWLALDPRHNTRSAIVGVGLRTESDLYLAIVGEIASLVPGSVVVEALRRNGMVYVHVLDLDRAGGVEAVRENILAIEKRVLQAIASDQELAAVGLQAGDAP
ncbi:MAG TPA: Na+/H+ antiporter subunit E [Acidimicrobiia bacterium]|nr:Na+/H+ antiporter subunit E [Acidimicrobiia bacterium]